MRKWPIMHGKTKPETATLNELVCAFEVCSCVLNFNVIGHYTILQTGKAMNTRSISGMLCCKKKVNQA